MKKCLLFLFSAVLFFAASCVKDNSDGENPKNILLTGRWHPSFIAHDVNHNGILEESEKGPVDFTHAHSYVFVTRGGGVAVDSTYTAAAQAPYNDTVYSFPASYALVGQDFLNIHTSRLGVLADTAFSVQLINVDSTTLTLMDTLHGGGKWYGFSRY